MRHRTEFEVGQQYRNRRRAYEVLAIEGDAMHIRGKAGEEVNTSVTMQSRILDNMQRELDHLALNKVASPRKKRDTSRGLHRVWRLVNTGNAANQGSSCRESRGGSPQSTISLSFKGSVRRQRNGPYLVVTKIDQHIKITHNLHRITNAFHPTTA